ncbi:MAG: hypothetical protein KZQ97_08960 [Candidatus Thiodiazotropha sp. (ex Dulcina madagascariensis)]|nr:hypothetical protein [Candidatus Thiodiazotropha sp. (ex Dulcina madagascariensis)]
MMIFQSRDKRNAIYALILMTSLTLSSYTGYGSYVEYRWRSIPLTTNAQAAAGIIGGEGFQQVMSISYAPSDPRVVYFGTDTAQVWKSIDAGLTWRKASKGMDSNGACSLFVHPKNADFVIAAGCLGPEAKRAHRSNFRREGIFRTVDGAANWDFIYKTEFHKQSSSGSLFAVDQTTLDKKDIVLYAGSHNIGLLKSSDSGKTWRKTNFRNGIIRDIEMSPVEPGCLLLATTKGLYSYCKGLVDQIGRGLPAYPSNIAVSPASPDRVFVAVDGEGVFISNDGGEIFKKSSVGLPPTSSTNIVNVFASPVDALQLYANSQKSSIKMPFYSNNAGNLWKMAETLNARGMTDGGGFWFASPIAPHPKLPQVALTASNGRTRILRTENGGNTWHYSGSGYTGARVNDMAFTNSQEWYVALTDHGLWKTNNGGRSFESIDIPYIKSKTIRSIALSGKTIVVSVGGWYDKQLLMSYDGGKSWHTAKGVFDRLPFIRFHPQKMNSVYASGFRSDNKGRTWSVLKHDVMAIYSDNGDIVYGFDASDSNVIESIDMGDTWHDVAYCGDKKIIVNEMASDPKVRGRLYLGTNQGLYRVDGGKCIKLGMDSGFIKDSHGSQAVRSVAVSPLDNSIVYAGRWAPGKGVSSGIIISTDFGNTWAPFNNGIDGSFNVWSVEIAPDAAVYIGTTHGLHILDNITENRSAEQ